jgi:hypothetical protein
VHELDAALDRNVALRERVGENVLDVHLSQQREVRKRRTFECDVGELDRHAPASQV